MPIYAVRYNIFAPSLKFASAAVDIIVSDSAEQAQLEITEGGQFQEMQGNNVVQEHATQVDVLSVREIPPSEFAVCIELKAQENAIPLLDVTLSDFLSEEIERLEYPAFTAVAHAADHALGEDLPHTPSPPEYREVMREGLQRELERKPEKQFVRPQIRFRLRSEFLTEN